MQEVWLNYPPHPLQVGRNILSLLMFILSGCLSLKLTSPPRYKSTLSSLKFFQSVCFFVCVCLLLTEVGKLLVISPKANWVLHGCHKAPSSHPLVSIVVLPCRAGPHFRWDPNPLFHSLAHFSPHFLPHYSPLLHHFAFHFCSLMTLRSLSLSLCLFWCCCFFFFLLCMICPETLNMSTVFVWN